MTRPAVEDFEGQAVHIRDYAPAQSDPAFRPISGQFLVTVGTATLTAEMTPAGAAWPRPYFLCPQCTKRFTKLYPLANSYACRNCTGLAYRSQRETARRRAFRQALATWERAGPVTDPRMMQFPPRPRLMRQRTYEKLRSKVARDLKRSGVRD